MQVADLANHPIEMNIGERTFKVKRLSLIQLFGDFENKVKKEHIDNVASLAKTIADKSERIQFQRESIRDVPTGVEMEMKVAMLIDSVEGSIALLYSSLKLNNEVTLDEVKELVANTKNSVDIQSVMSYISGDDIVEKKEDPTDPNKTIISTEKKT